MQIENSAQHIKLPLRRVPLAKQKHVTKQIPNRGNTGYKIQIFESQENTSRVVSESNWYKFNNRTQHVPNYH